MVSNRRLAPASAAKPRLKWTRQLHQQFVGAVSHLGGAAKATPRSVMRLMGVPGLSLCHLKSHLQKYRIAVNSNPEPCCEPNSEPRVSSDHCRRPWCYFRTLPEMQTEVPNKFQEQIEVQRHLQLRMEAQEKYIRSVLKKAQEKLSVYSRSSTEMAAAVDREIAGGSFSYGGLAPSPAADCSSSSCLTTLERPEEAGEWPSTNEPSTMRKTDGGGGIYSGHSCHCLNGAQEEESSSEEIDLNR
ncbi:unnamed protein product [Spirodela intermedia]|uniref:MYB-CC type transcription factor LHEQLE-containing domain-containing protein n=1 Tax=Spirodela intermedia TaxID=51605 RepID=A0A7I8ILP0_SPIIN|nr:unnamed protein product [Spirodela intermedia]CAA6658757.1 unnamed protein product [Spirodela intermedia]